MGGSAVIHIVLMYIFRACDMGYTGICLATTFAFASRFFIGMLLLKLGGKFKDTEDVAFFSKETTSNVGN